MTAERFIGSSPIEDQMVTTCQRLPPTVTGGRRSSYVQFDTIPVALHTTVLVPACRETFFCQGPHWLPIGCTVTRIPFFCFPLDDRGV